MSDYLAFAHAELRRQRRALGGKSPEMFAEIYLPEHCPLAFSRMHKEVFDALAGLVEKRAGRLAIAAPRDHAKSTIVSLAFVLWCVLYEKEKFVVLVSATQDQATLLLKAIRDELQKNAVLLTDFPETCQPEHTPRRPKPWRRERISLPNGAMIAAYGAGQGLRGAKNVSNRPGLIVADDIENPEHVISEEQRQKLCEWFANTLLHAGHPATNVIVVGTVLHHDSLLANLIDPNDPRGWRGVKYRAVERFSDRPNFWETWASIFRGKEDHDGDTGPDAAKAFFESNRDEMLKGAQVLWPEREDYYALMVTREREGRASFQAEKQNEPIDPEVCIFSEENFHYWDDEDGDVESLFDAVGRDGYFHGACDPSLGHRTGRGDYTAIVIVYQSTDPMIDHVIVADIARRTPDEAIERIIQYARMYSFDDFAVETNHFQELMVDNLRERAKKAGVALPLSPITNRSNKQSRIAALEPEVTQGKIRFCRRHQLLLNQLQQFPLAAHDDGPDALQMAIEVTRCPRLPLGPNVVGVHTW